MVNRPGMIDGVAYVTGMMDLLATWTDSADKSCRQALWRPRCGCALNGRVQSVKEAYETRVKNNNFVVVEQHDIFLTDAENALHSRVCNSDRMSRSPEQSMRRWCANTE